MIPKTPKLSQNRQANTPKRPHQHTPTRIFDNKGCQTSVWVDLWSTRQTQLVGESTTNTEALQRALVGTTILKIKKVNSAERFQKPHKNLPICHIGNYGQWSTEGPKTTIWSPRGPTRRSSAKKLRQIFGQGGTIYHYKYERHPSNIHKN